MKQNLTSPRINAPKKAFLITFFFAFSVLTFIYTFTLACGPRGYESVARVEVFPDKANLRGLTYSPYDPRLVQTELKAITSPPVLMQVIDELDLNSVWAAKFGAPAPARLSSEASLNLLQHLLNTHSYRNTAIAEIACLGDQPSECEKIANAVVRISHERASAGGGGLHVEILDKAHLPLRPAHPNIPLGIILGILKVITYALLAGIIVRGIVIWVLNASRPNNRVTRKVENPMPDIRKY